MKILWICNCFLWILVLLSCSQRQDSIETQSQACSLAEGLWVERYGELVLEEKPYRATLVNDSIWVVEGTLPKDRIGGVAYIEIRKKDGLVITISHEK